MKIRSREGGICETTRRGSEPSSNLRSHVLGGGRASAKTLRWDELYVSEEWLEASGAAV